MAKFASELDLSLRKRFLRNYFHVNPHPLLELLNSLGFLLKKCVQFNDMLLLGNLQKFFLKKI